MNAPRKHIVILPHFCEQEVERYELIASRIAEWDTPNVEIDFLVAASPKREPSQRLMDAFENIGNVVAFKCPTQIFGYPEGPTAMFWDCMEFIAKQYPGADGFALWLESDMCPTQENWLDVLSEQWFIRDAQGRLPLMMGCFVPEVYKHRIFKQPKKILDPHINGGACYAMDFATRMPEEAREGVFDMAVYQFAADLGLARETRSICFSTVGRVGRDLADSSKVLLHGFMQEKDEFIEKCVAPVNGNNMESRRWMELKDRADTAQRKMKVWFVRRGKKAMLENMFLAKQRYERENPLDGSGEPAVAEPTRKVA